jgi:hypothetical protein
MNARTTLIETVKSVTTVLAIYRVLAAEVAARFVAHNQQPARPWQGITLKRHRR